MSTKKENYRISIIGTQELDGESDTIEVITDGNFIRRNGHFYIGYKEYNEDNPGDYCDNLVKVEENTVTIIRKGSNRSQLILEKNKRHQCLYRTVAGDMMIGVFTKTLDNRLDQNGGEIEVSYTLDFNSDLVSENSFKIKVEKRNREV